MIGIIIAISLVVIFLLFFMAINISKTIAYKLYKIPKIHWVVKFLTFRNKEYLKGSEFCVPRSVMPVVDDIGWSLGKDDRKNNGPSRLVAKRNPTVLDYEKIINIGKISGTRIPCMMVISDFDKKNTCAKEEYNIDSFITEKGTSWKNTTPIEFSKRVMDLLYANSAYIEMGLHGVRHEHFDKNGMKNAEWADGEIGCSWGEEYTDMHCQIFEEILREYFTSNQCSFPESFVPPSHAFAFYSQDAKILHKYGVKYLYVSCAKRPSIKFFRHSGVFSDGILMLDRTDITDISHEALTPKKHPETNSWIGTHFPNFWGKSEKKWVKYLKGLNKNALTMLGRNSRSNNSQWIYNHHMASIFEKGKIYLNNLYMPQWAYDSDFIDGVWLKINLHKKEHVSQINVNGLKLGAYYEDEYNNAYLYLIADNKKSGTLEKEIYKGEYLIGKTLPTTTYVDIGKETFSIKNILDDGNKIYLKLVIYGEHNLKIKTANKFTKVACKSSNVTSINTSAKTIEMKLKSTNMISEEIELEIEYQ